MAELFLIAGVMLAAVAGLFGFDDDTDQVDDSVETPEDDDLNATGSEQLFGSDADDEGSASENSEVYGGGGDDTLTGRDTATIFGDSGDDRLNVTDLSTAFGGDGDDTFVGAFSDGSEVYGGDGDDLFSSFDSGTLDGGDGNDTFEMDVSEQNDALPTTITGGAGDDVFQFDTGQSRDGGASEFAAVITDFNPEEDVLAFEYSNLEQLDGLNASDLIIEENADENFVNVRIPFADEDGDPLLIRLDGISSLDPESITFKPAFGDEDGLQLLSETDSDDVVALTDDAILLAGDGRDDVSIDTERWIVDLSNGADEATVLKGSGSLFGGNGDDDILVDADTDSDATVFGGAGSDTIDVDAGNAEISTIDDSDETGAVDTVTTSADSGEVHVEMGHGSDIVSIHQGQTAEFTSPGSSHSITIDIVDSNLDHDPAQITSNGLNPTQAETENEVVLNIAGDVEGDISFDVNVETESIFVGEAVDVYYRTLTVSVGDVDVLEYRQYLSDREPSDDTLNVDTFNLTIVR